MKKVKKKPAYNLGTLLQGTSPEQLQGVSNLGQGIISMVDAPNQYGVHVRS